MAAGALTDDAPIDRLKPGDALTDMLVAHLKARLEMSERKMARFYPRWRAREKQLQAYMDLPKYEAQLKEMNKSGEPPVITALTIPYSYATISTIATYLTHAFTGRKPLFQIGANSAEGAANAENVSTMLQYQADTRLMIKRWMQFFKDSETYGVGAMKCVWEMETRMRTTVSKATTGEYIRRREPKVTYEGNDLDSIDPFLFFPDPRVPMSEAPFRAEFIFWRDFIGPHEVAQGEADYGYKWINNLGSLPENLSGSSGVSARSLAASGDSQPGMSRETQDSALPFVQRDECTIWLIPSKMKDAKGKALGEGTKPEMWIFTLLNKKRIVRAEPFNYDHGMHPVVTMEPQTVGYGFGHMSTADYLAPLQDAASWFLNSHIYNVRSALNNMLVVNPAMVEMKDLASPKPGKIIRLKRSAMGQDVRNAIHQLDISDITRGHVTDLENIMRMGDMLSSVNDNLRGIQDAGGRKTATEVRTAGEAGASRLASQARLYSAQAFSPLGSMMCVNSQQFLSREYEMRVLGSDPSKSIMIGPEMIVGDYYFPIHDGTLPMDKTALVDIWKEILMGVAKDPELRQTFSMEKIFEWVAELGGAKNIQSFKRVNGVGGPAALAPTIAPPGADPTNAIQAGNAVPMPGVL